MDPEDWCPPRCAARVERTLASLKARGYSLLVMDDIHATTVDHVDELFAEVRKIPNTQFVLH